MLFGVHANELNVAEVPGKLSDAVCVDPPKTAEMTTTWPGEPTPTVGTNVTLLAPAGTATLAGTLTTDELLVSVITPVAAAT